MASDPHRLSGRLARWNATSFSMVFGVLMGVGLCAATWTLVLVGGESPGRHIALLGQYFRGYTVTFWGGLVGFFWAAIVGGAIAFPAAWIYYLGVLHKVEGARSRSGGETLAGAEMHLHLPTFALALGSFCGFLLALATLLLLWTNDPGRPLGPHLSLLGRYMPGYDVSAIGALVGFLYFTLFGVLVFGAVGVIYNFLLLRLPHPPVAHSQDGSGHD